MGFEQYHRDRRIFPDEALVSVSKAGMLTFNARCSEQFLKGTSQVTLFFNRERQLIGVRPEKQKSEDSYPVKRFGTRPTAQVAAMGFLKYFRIDYSATRRYAAQWNEKEGLIEIDIGAEYSKREREEKQEERAVAPSAAGMFAGMTVGEATRVVLKEAGKAMHFKEIHRLLEQGGLRVKATSVPIMLNRYPQTFAKVGRGQFKFAEKVSEQGKKLF